MMNRSCRVVLTLSLNLGLAGGALAAQAASPDTAKVHPVVTPADAKQRPPVPHLFTPGDLTYIGGAIGVVTFSFFGDQWLTNEAVETENNHNQQRLAQFFQPLGNPAYVLAGSMALYGGARWIGHPQLARRSARVGLAVTIAAAVASGIKEIVGRERPLESPNNSTVFKPFSGHVSFPSGHAATAFAAAVALDRETRSRWVPYIVYPAATLVGWSRVHDRQHWTSDVVGGAAIGGWTAWKTETFLAHHSLGVPPQGQKKTSWLIAPEPGGAELVVVRRLD